jgi:hypothetical protein
MRLYDVRLKKSVRWRKPSYCAAGECPEIAKHGDVILMRSSNAPRIVVTYTPEEYYALKQAILSGELDDIG